MKHHEAYVQPSEDEGWKSSCMVERGRVLTGRFAHYCMDWDGLTVDETCIEADCCHDVYYDKAALEQIKRTVEEFKISQESHATPGRQSADVGTERVLEGVPTQRT